MQAKNPPNFHHHTSVPRFLPRTHQVTSLAQHGVIELLLAGVGDRGGGGALLIDDEGPF